MLLVNMVFLLACLCTAVSGWTLLRSSLGAHRLPARSLAFHSAKYVLSRDNYQRSGVQPVMSRRASNEVADTAEYMDGYFEEDEDIPEPKHKRKILAHEQNE
jgi:hypothetical protein